MRRKHTIKMVLFGGLLAVFGTGQVMAGGILDKNGDGVQIDDIVKYMNENKGADLSAVKSSFGQLAGTMSPAAPGIPGSGTVKTGVINGKVVDETGAPVVDALVELYGGSAYRDMTDAQGLFTIENAPISFDVHIVVSKNGYIGAESAPFNVLANQPASAGTVTLPRINQQYGTVTGYVYKDGGGPITNAAVTVTGATYTSPAITNSFGFYMIPNVVAGPQTITVTAATYVSKQVPVTVVPLSSTVVNTVYLTSQTSNAFGGITGKVTGYQGGALADATVRLLKDGVIVEGMQTTTNIGGQFTFSNLPVGQLYTLKIEALDYESVATNTSVLVQGGVNATAGETQLQLKPSSISGTVLDSGSHPLPAATVTLGTNSAVTGSDGRFVIDNIRLPRGSYALSVHSPLETGGATVQLVPGQPNELPSPIVTAAVGNITLKGKVVTENGSAVAGVSVLLKGYDHSERTATTGVDGTYTFTGLASNQYYSLSVTAAGFAPSPQYQFWTNQAGTVNLRNVELQTNEQIGTVKGKVVDWNGITPVSGVHVYLQYVDIYSDSTSMPLAGFPTFEAVSDAAGEFTFPYVAADQEFVMTMYYNQPGYIYYWNNEPLTVSAGEELNETLRLQKSVSVSTLEQMVAAINDPAVGEIKLTADISTLSDTNSTNDILESDHYVRITADLPYTLIAKEFGNNIIMVGNESGVPRVNMIASVGSDKNAFERSFLYKNWMLSEIRIQNLNGYSGSLKKRIESVTDSVYFTLDTDNDATAFVTTGLHSLQAALNNPQIGTVVVPYSIWGNSPLTMPNRRVDFIGWPEPEQELFIQASSFIGYNPDLVGLENIHLVDSAAPSIVSISTVGATSSIAFSKQISAFSGWRNAVNVTGETAIHFADENAFVLSPDGKTLTVTFDRPAAAGDKLMFYGIISEYNSQPMNNIVYLYSGTSWNEVPNLPGDTEVYIDPISDITRRNDAVYVNVSGKTDDPQGNVYTAPVSVSLQQVESGLYYDFEEGKFSSATEIMNSENVYEYFSYGNAKWSLSIYNDTPLVNGTYRIHAVVQDGDNVKGSEFQIFNVNVVPYIYNIWPTTALTETEDAFVVSVDSPGTLYVVSSDITVTGKADLDAAAAEHPDKAKQKAVQSDWDIEMSTIGLIPGSYRVYLADDNDVLSLPKDVLLQDGGPQQVASVVSSGRDVTVTMAKTTNDTYMNTLIVPVAAAGTAPVAYDSINPSEIGADHKTITLHFTRPIADGDRLLISNISSAISFKTMDPVVYQYSAGSWSVVANAPLDSAVTINPLSDITNYYNTGYFIATGTVSDPQGDVYAGPVKISIKRNSTGKYFDDTAFEADTSEGPASFQQWTYWDNGVLKWSISKSVPELLKNDTYTVTAVVANGDPVKGSASATFTVNSVPTIPYVSADTSTIQNANAFDVSVSNSGGIGYTTFYLVHSSLSASDQSSLDAVAAGNPGKALKITGNGFSSMSISTVGLTETGIYRLYAVDNRGAISAAHDITLISGV